MTINAVVASLVLLSAAPGVGAVGDPEKPGDASGAFAASALVIVVAKFGSSPSAVANSLSVSSLPGAEATSAAIAFCTNAVVARLVSLSPGAGVGAVGLPVNAGEASNDAMNSESDLSCGFPPASSVKKLFGVGATWSISASKPVKT